MVCNGSGLDEQGLEPERKTRAAEADPSPPGLRLFWRAERNRYREVRGRSEGEGNGTFLSPSPTGLNAIVTTAHTPHSPPQPCPDPKRSQGPGEEGRGRGRRADWSSPRPEPSQPPPQTTFSHTASLKRWAGPAQQQRPSRAVAETGQRLLRTQRKAHWNQVGVARPGLSLLSPIGCARGGGGKAGRDEPAHSAVGRPRGFDGRGGAFTPHFARRLDVACEKGACP